MDKAAASDQKTPAAAMEVEEAVEECAVKQVDLTVPKTDDPTLPVLTFRMWVLGISSCVLLSLINQFYWYRSNPLSVTSTSAMIAVVPIGHLMAKTLPSRSFFKGTSWEFSLNPGPFNVKEHVLITIFATTGSGGVYASHILSAVKLYYKKELSFLPSFIVMVTTQVLGFGWAGLFRKYLIEPGEMWWPNDLVKVSLFRVLHTKEKRPKGGTTRTQYFLIVLVSSFAYYILPGYLFLSLQAFSWVCLLAPKSVLVQQLGSGSSGLGIGSFALEWSAVAAYLGSPLASPWFASANIAVGFFLVMYVMTPLSYWLNVYKAKNFPIFSSSLFKANGEIYDVLDIVDSNFHLDREAYAARGHVHLSTFFAMTYGLGFATLSATLVHVLLFGGGKIWRQSKRAFGGSNKMDIHTKLMKKYKSVPTWWFLVILVVNIALTMYAVQHYRFALQLPWWGVLLACCIALCFTLPLGIIYATTNQLPGLNIITEYVIGYIYPEHPVANMCFKVYGYISMTQAVSFLEDFKLGHYMKIPPRAMFMAQVVGTLVSTFVCTGTAWVLMGSVPHLCDTTLLPADSPWTCPMDHVFYDASVIWGLVGPRRMFGNLGLYSNVNWFFLGGAIAPLLCWLAQKAFPNKTWIRNIHFPVLLGSTAMMPPASSVNFIMWIALAFLSGYVLFKHRPEWWKRYNYVTSGALDAGTAFMTILVFLALQQSKDVSISWWGNMDEMCPLATCPTAKGIVVDGCPLA